jgi:hypothetical protein
MTSPFAILQARSIYVSSHDRPGCGHTSLQFYYRNILASPSIDAITMVRASV